jgi:hypothetical protein
MLELRPGMGNAAKILFKQDEQRALLEMWSKIG